MEVPRQEYWSGLPFPSSRDLPGLGIEPMSLVSPALAGGNSLPRCHLASLLLLKFDDTCSSLGSLQWSCSRLFIWNSPPSDADMTPSLTFFRSLLKHHLLSEALWTLYIKPPHPAPWLSLSSPPFILPLNMHVWYLLCLIYLLSIWPPSTPRGFKPAAVRYPVCFVHDEAQYVSRRRGDPEFMYVSAQ